MPSSLKFFTLPVQKCTAGGNAPVYAALRADELLAAGAMEGKAVWVRIAKAAEESLSDKQADGATIRDTSRRIIGQPVAEIELD